MKTTAQESKDWILPARLEQVNAVCAEMEAWLVGKISSGQLFPLHILAREALNNAVIHGCRESADKWIRFTITLAPGEIQLVVEDDGPGFDWKKYLKRKSVNVNAECGRGLMIYTMYADEIEFNPKGNCVRISRYLPENW